MSKAPNGKDIMNKKKGIAIVIAASLLAMAGAFILSVDTEAGETTPLTITGYVYDTDGTTPVSGATVTIRDQDTGAWGTNTSNATGFFKVDMRTVPSDMPWSEWFIGDQLYGVATDGTMDGVNTTMTTDPNGLHWMNFTLGTPATTKTVGAPEHLKYNYDTGSANRGYLVSPEIHLGGPTATLSFYTWWQIESSNPVDNDLMNVYLSTTGGYLDGTEVNLTEQQDSINPGTNPAGGGPHSFLTPAGLNTMPGSWDSMTYDLTDWVGENVTIIFEFDTVDGVYNYWEGWYLDDIRIGSYGTFFDDVENGVGNWSYNGLWHIDDRRSYSASHAWYYGMEHSYVTEETLFNMAATGNYTNITYDIWYNQTGWQGPFNYTEPFNLTGECKHYIEFFADNASYNDEPLRNQTHYVDMSPPTSTMELGSPNATLEYEGENFSTIRTCTPMWINATDEVAGIEECASGVEWLNYTVWRNEVPNDYELIETVSIHDNDENDMDKRPGFISAELHFDEECFHEIKWDVEDYVGHRADQQSIDISVDGTAPTIEKTIGEPKYVGLGNYGAINWTWVNCSTNFTFHVTDSGCGGGIGVEEFGMKIYWNETRVPQGDVQDFTLIETIVVHDGGPQDLDGEENGEILYNYSFNQECFHEPEMWAVDEVGNEYKFKEKDMVDCTPPAIRKDVDKVVAYEQTEMNNASDIGYGGEWQRFQAPWSYMDAVQIHLCGTFYEGVTVQVYDNLSHNPLRTATLDIADVPVNESDYFCGWLQLHLDERLYTEHNASYWLHVTYGGTSGMVYWNASDNDPYPWGNGTIGGRPNWNDSRDYTFKIEYYPVVLDDMTPTLLDYMFAEYNETGDYDYLHESWVTTEAFFNLSSWDEGCMDGVGLDTLEYRVWWNGTWTEWMNYTEPFNFTEECVHYIEIRATDLLGNTRIVNQTHYVDDSPPELQVQYPDVHGFYKENDTGKQFVRANKTFYLNLTDMPEEPCAVGTKNFTFYWRYEYTNFTAPLIETHPADGGDNEYPGELVYAKGHWWWKLTQPEDRSIALNFTRECQHTIYYWYEASDWLDNEVETDVQEEVIYVDEHYPEMQKEHPDCYDTVNANDTIYVHPSEELGIDSPWTTPSYPNSWMSTADWTEFYPEHGREYLGVDDEPHFDGFISNGNDIVDDCDYIELYDVEYGVYRLYHVENLTVTLEIYNDTLDEVKYVDFVSYWDGYWPADSDFAEIESSPIGTLWKEMHADFGTMYNLTAYESQNGFSSATITLNNTATGEWHNWTVMDATWDLVLDPVPFIQKCAKIDLTANDTPQILKLVDQFQNEGARADELQLKDNIPYWPWDAQRFMVTENVTHINEIWLYLNWSGPSNVSIYLHNHTDPESFTPGQEIAQANATLTGADDGWVKFMFDDPVPVDSTTTYVIDAFRKPNSAQVQWIHSENSSYLNGYATISGEDVTDGDWKFSVVAYRENPCASGIEDIYYGYEFNGTYHPMDMEDNESTYGDIVNISKYYDDVEIEEEFGGRYLWYTYDPAKGVHFHEECIHWLYYWTKDNVCHHTDVHRQVYHVDEYNPVVYKEHPDHGYSAPVEISVEERFDNASDAYEGEFHVRNKWYSSSTYPDGWLRNPSGQNIYKDQSIDLTITNHDLNNDLTLTIRVEEVVGDEGITLENGSDVNQKTYTVFVPAGGSNVLTIPVYDYRIFLEWGVWHWEVVSMENITQYLRAGAKINLTADDPGYCASGVQGIYYRYEWNDTMYPQTSHPAAVDGSTLSGEPEIANYWWYLYNDSEDITFSEECVHDLYYFAKDRSCHNSTLHHQVYHVDDSAPVVEEELPDHGAIGNTTQSLWEGFYLPVGNGWATVNDTGSGSTHSYWDLHTDEPYFDYHDLTNAYKGDYDALAWTDTDGSADSWLISPKVAIPEDGNLSFWYATYRTSSYDASFKVAVNNVSTQTDTSAFTTVWDSGPFGDNTYRKTEIDLSAYAGQEVYIGFHCDYLEQNYWSSGLLIDDVWVGGIEHVDWKLDDDVESGQGGWTVDDLTVDGSMWRQVDRIPVYDTDPPQPSMWCGDPALDNGDYGLGQYGCNWDDVLMLTEPINMSDADPGDNVWLDFWFWLNSECCDDMFIVEVTNDSSDWANASIVYTWSGDFTSWQQEQILLSDFIGNDTVYIRFRFVSDDHPTADNGVFLDNVSVYNSTMDFIPIQTFDNPWNNWTAMMLETSKWHIVDTQSHSPDHSWWNGDDDTDMYLNCMNDALVSPVINLTGEAYEEAMLTFWHWRDMYTYDHGYVEIRECNGGTWSGWSTMETYSYQRGWVQEFVDITDEVGHPDQIQIRFRFYSNTDTVDPGWYLDDFRVELRNITGTNLTEDFEKTFPPTGWMEDGNYETSHYYGWNRYLGTDYSYAAVHAHNSYNQDEWLISPLIENLPKFSNLTFEHHRDGSATTRLYISTDNGSTWTHLETYTGTISGIVEDEDLWGYHGQDIRLAWRFTSPSGDGTSPYDDYWAIEWAEVTSIGFLREGAPINLQAYDRPVNSTCDAGVSAIYWRYSWDGDDDLGDGDAYVWGDDIPGIASSNEEIADYYWWKIMDNGEFDDDDRQGYIEVNISLEGECIHDVYYFAKDILCHSSELHEETYYVDGSAPDTYLNISWGSNGTHPWIPKNSGGRNGDGDGDRPTQGDGHEPMDYWYAPGEDKPDVICIQDDFHFYANHTHSGTEPCIYPYNHQNNTFFRWRWWNPETEKYEFWPSADNADAINGSTITVSENEDYIQWNDDSSFWIDKSVANWDTTWDDYIENYYGGYIQWMPYMYPDEEFFEQGCNHTLYYFSKDDLCNTEMPVEWDVGVDDEAPETEFDINVTTGCKYYDEADNTWYFQDCSWVNINATDMPNNTECRTGIWYMDYTIWKWNATQEDINIWKRTLPTPSNPTTVYVGTSPKGSMTDAIDNDDDGNLSYGDYVHIDFDSSVNLSDGWYYISWMNIDMPYTLTVRDIYSGAGGWDVLVPWSRVYANDTSGLPTGITVDGGADANYNWMQLNIHLGDLNPGDFNCGKYEIHWKVYDYNNRTIGERKQDVAIDCTDPRTSKEFGEPVVEQEISGGEIIHWVNPATTKIWLNGTEDYRWDSGVAETWYRFWEEQPILVWKLNNATFEQPNYPGVMSDSKHWFTIDEAAQIMGYADAEDYFASNPNVNESRCIVELYHWSKDRVCHVEDGMETKQHIYVDFQPPTSHVEEIVPYQREDVPINLTVTDIMDHGCEDSGPVGVCEVELYYRHSTDNETYGDWYLYDTLDVPWADRHDVPDWDVDFDASAGPGWYQFKSVAYDCVENQEQPPFEQGEYDAECVLVADMEPPVIEKEDGQPMVQQTIGDEPIYVLTWDTPIYVNVTDQPDAANASGVNELKIAFTTPGDTPGSGDWIPVDMSEWDIIEAGDSGHYKIGYTFTPAEYSSYIDNETIYHLYVYAADMYGHEVDEKTQKFMIDDTAPTTTIDVNCTGDMPFDVEATASDAIVDVQEITLYYRYSPDNETNWTAWTAYDTIAGDSHTWSFSTDDGYGYYQFYVYAEDELGNHKPMPTDTYEAWCHVPAPPEDLNGDGRVSTADILLVLDYWGETGSPGWIPEDLSGPEGTPDGTINIFDVLAILDEWTG